MVQKRARRTAGTRSEGDPAADENRPDEERKTPRKSDESKGAGRKHAVQPNPDDQRGRPDPKEME